MHVTESIDHLVGDERLYKLVSQDAAVVLHGEQLPTDVALILKPGLEELAAAISFPLWVRATVTKPIYVDENLEYLVLDVEAVFDERPSTSDTDRLEDSGQSTAADQSADTLQEIAEELVGEMQVESTARTDSDTVVTDRHGERDRADATRSSPRDRDIRSEMNPK